MSSSVTIAVPFSLGKVLDIIYSSTNDLGATTERLDSLCLMLCGVFLVGGLCNFGRVYLMSISGKFVIFLNTFRCMCKLFMPATLL